MGSLQLQSSLPCWKTSDDVVADLKGMRRSELLEMFLRCEPPSLSDLAFSEEDDDAAGDGGWRYDGYLLDNGPILTPVTGFITNRLFGRGRPWLGKAYSKPTTAASTSSNFVGGVVIGKNRFSSSSSSSDNDDELLDRTFDCTIDASVLSSPDAAASTSSMFQRYAPHCPVSLRSPIMPLVWAGMVDELRVVDAKQLVDAGGKEQHETKVLLGMGYFAWSLGVWNAAPFCLVARRVMRHRMEKSCKID